MLSNTPKSFRRKLFTRLEESMSKRSKSKTGVNNIIDPILWARDSLPTDQFQNLMRIMDEPIPAAIKVNLLKSTSEDLIDKCADLYHWKSDPVPFCPSGFWITDSEVPLSRTIEHRLGYYYIQESASMLPAELFDFSEN